MRLLRVSNLITIDQIIELFHLKPLDDEGGLFAETYRSSDVIFPSELPWRFPRMEKAFGTAILYLLTSDDNSFSRLHQLITDEVFHFYLGDAVEMLLLFPDGTSDKIILGQDIIAGEHVQYVVPRDVWQGSQLMEGGQFALLGTTMVPGFDPSDYKKSDREELVNKFPQEADLIRRLTR